MNAVTQRNFEAFSENPLENKVADWVDFWPKQDSPGAYDIRVPDQLSRNLARDDVAVYPGEAITELRLKKEEEKRKFLDLISRFANEGFFKNEDTNARVSKETAESARALFEMLLKKIKTIPKIAPDGEGNLLAIWKNKADPVMLIVENWRLHLITSAATPHAVYHDNLQFDGQDIPAKIVQATRNAD